MRQSVRIRAIYQPDGTEYTWTASRFRTSFKSNLQEWFYTTHDGTERYGGRTWQECVARILATADGYNCQAIVS